MSDGTNRAALPGSGDVARDSAPIVRDGAQAVAKLNELEIVKGEIWANVWQTDRIARIEPRRPGHGLDRPDRVARPRARHPVDVLNGIAYDAEADRLFVTGKLWPKLFEIEVVPR